VHCEQQRRALRDLCPYPRDSMCGMGSVMWRYCRQGEQHGAITAQRRCYLRVTRTVTLGWLPWSHQDLGPAALSLLCC
jgi:hypothetical protein